MGAYLTSPVCEKETHEGSNQNLAFAASSMQGWRMSQEDAHNAIINFDENTALFAVYDGHGGSEIAVYCSKYLPEFLKTLTSYKEGKFKEALIESFIKFDSKLLEPDVKKVLQKLANEDDDEEEEEEEEKNHEVEHEFVGSLNPNEENHHNDGLNGDEAQLLQNEAQIPIEELVKRYQNDENQEEKNPNVEIDAEQQTITLKSSETSPSSSTKRVRKPVTDTETSVPIQTTSLLRHFISNNPDGLDDDDDDEDESFHESDEETSGDEAEDHEHDETPLDANKTAQIQKLMKKSILAILNQRHKKKKEDSDESKENENGEESKDDDDDNNEEDGEEEDEEENEDEDDDDDNDENEEEEGDAGMIDMDNDPGSSSGCTAVVTLLHNRELFVANAGDSRCVVCRNGRAIEMSFDHKPEDTEERQRIEKAGFKVTLDGRVSGGLNLSRAIGDHAYKKKSSLPAEEQAITALPDIRTLTLDAQDEFMVLACDGIWNFMSSQDVIDFVRLRLEKKSLGQICEELFMHCLAPNTHGDGTGCDNMTAIIVKFTSNNSTTNKRSLSSDDIQENLTNKKLKNGINSVD